MDDDEWSDPPLATDSDPDSSSSVDRQRLAIRLVCSFATLLVLVYLTRGFLAEATTALWPPTDPLAQWATFVLLHAFGYVIVPLMVGSFVADVLLERVQN
ncbi:hypothetical protein OB955_03350 [Halobacteria archaeon AArc-m2/3/4]|uniref:Uncharacterized protein n=1 Tax=Natronoglomus mannanivorans TaxID=2979990 RepID=A0AAP2YV87_9EURY|nr:hypothetical protein [Halobacteria archaeon AArc-xg1-1]MCU4971774.1 hypothetical protein [Halobacteria archaeon AArc-m2/3/4]